MFYKMFRLIFLSVRRVMFKYQHSSLWFLKSILVSAGSTAPFNVT